MVNLVEFSLRQAVMAFRFLIAEVGLHLKLVVPSVYIWKVRLLFENGVQDHRDSPMIPDTSVLRGKI